MKGQRKRLDLETQDELEVSLATDGQRLGLGDFCMCVSVIALDTDKNTSVLDGLYKNQATMGTPRTYIQRPADI